jgi:hypothetical protein
MTYDNRQVIYSGIAEVVIGRYRCVTGGGPGVVIPTSGGALPIWGISLDVWAAAGERVEWVAHGPAKARLGPASVTRGLWLRPDSTGALVAAVSGEWAIARAEQLGNAGEVIDVFIQPTKV